MATDIRAVDELRKRTGAGLMDCKRALDESGGDMAGAVLALKKKGLAGAEKREDRLALEGSVFSYIHTGGRIGVLLQLNCETDFVAKNELFQTLGRDLCLHIAASNPCYVGVINVPPAETEREMEVARSQAQGRPPQAVGAFIEGKMAKFHAQVCLLSQPFVKDPSQTVEELVRGHIARIGENIRIGRFARFQVGG
ncbi:MAG: elongation factor Ts [Puniceicoccales bacterium]|jgi:elongation factor Ts|nr:elongation factor Ts [Puniceicoccales bacterium]